MKLKLVILAAMAVLTLGSAQAGPAPKEWGTLDTIDGAASAYSAAAGTSYARFYNFTLDDTYNFFATAVANNNANSIFDNNFVTFQMDNGSGWTTLGSFGFDNVSTTYSFGPQNAGDYRLEVKGDSVGTDTAYGTVSTRITAVPVVPEPGTYVLLMAGMGVLGFVARRRNST